MSETVELERSNLNSLHAANSDEKRLKTPSEELKLKVRLEGKKNKERRKTGQLERKRFIRANPERN